MVSRGKELGLMERSGGVISLKEQLARTTCNVCSRTTRFPRYNDAIELLETKKGWCGEWANCFSLYCHSFGYESHLKDIQKLGYDMVLPMNTGAEGVETAKKFARKWDYERQQTRNS
ncbi:peptide-N(4)-(N-acetyl-beta-glucosaminyl) asparagine amidase isoform X2 [Tanacetum coccineum]